MPLQRRKPLVEESSQFYIPGDGDRCQSSNLLDQASRYIPSLLFVEIIQALPEGVPKKLIQPDAFTLICKARVGKTKGRTGEDISFVIAPEGSQLLILPHGADQYIIDLFR